MYGARQPYTFAAGSESNAPAADPQLLLRVVVKILLCVVVKVLLCVLVKILL
jgi:hypothetical protein